MAFTSKCPDSFQDFYKGWKDEQNHQLHQLITAAKKFRQPQTDSSLSGLVDLVISKYQEHYRIKSKWAKKHVFLMFSPPLTTPLELAFIWVGGWRPTTAFHLLYSKSDPQSEATFSNRVKTGGLRGDQLLKIDQLQRITIQQEREIDEKVAKQQERVADREIIELSNTGRVDSVLKKRKEGFRRVLQSADDLRLRTLVGVVGILSPIQAVHFLIAAAELKLRLHEWGKEREERRTDCEAV